MPTPTSKFKGSYTELQTVVTQAGGAGTWVDNGNEKRFNSRDGGVVKWWESTQSLMFQGDATDGAKLRAAILSGGAESPGPPPAAQKRVFSSFTVTTRHLSNNSNSCFGVWSWSPSS